MVKALSLVPYLIITDLMMPGMDGLEVCRQACANEIINHIPIIVITAKIIGEERIKGLEAGADAPLSKPFNADELHTRVEKLLEGRRMLQEKFAGMMQERKAGTQQDSARTNDADVRFLAKVSTVVYSWLERSKEVDIALITSAMCMSPRQFHRNLNALVGYSPAAYIQRLKIKRARILMDKDVNMSLAEVADLCGFDAYPNFVRAFKNVCGVTPIEYRRGSDA